MRMDFQHGVPYSSGLIAQTDLHAGGVFFGFVYSEFLTFNDDHTVTQTFEIFDTFAQMDNESKSLGDKKGIGYWRINARGQIVCEFKESVYTGIACKYDDPPILAFNVYYKTTQRSTNRVFTSTNSR